MRRTPNGARRQEALPPSARSGFPTGRCEPSPRHQHLPSRGDYLVRCQIVAELGHRGQSEHRRALLVFTRWMANGSQAFEAVIWDLLRRWSLPSWQPREPAATERSATYLSHLHSPGQEVLVLWVLTHSKECIATRTASMNEIAGVPEVPRPTKRRPPGDDD